ncbi:class I SAM-dependent methyltransferase [Amycolatopsis decaplanina]|uniref:Type 12 methyltransferase n=1 Tax=Amycolatopsis decaplanina DSM 44594 TaxID=1284240 RepID=M2Z101_9PSEU|nr:class I SAM-dependent methyltransferase [Amycolatopsis decaplanina]EME60937.1 type 12 methyltransferase [Amycolatopsis decaplanina DSM 44594]
MSAELIASLAEHPWIDAAHAEGGIVRLRPARAATAVRPEPGPLVAEYLEHWGEVYDFTYSAGSGPRSDEPDFSGWKSSETGEPFSTEHMTDWVDRTVDLVLAHSPRFVLELGCGTGLLARKLGPHIEGYVGTDVAQAAVDRLAAEAEPGRAHVRAAAHEVAAPAVRAAMARRLSRRGPGLRAAQFGDPAFPQRRLSDRRGGGRVTAAVSRWNPRGG